MNFIDVCKSTGAVVLENLLRSNLISMEGYQGLLSELTSLRGPVFAKFLIQSAITTVFIFYVRLHLL